MKTDNFLEKIASAEIGKNDAANPSDIAMARVELKKSGLPNLPEEYSQVLLKFNGLSNEGAVLLGVEKGNNFFPSVVTYNQDFFKGAKTDFLILGYDNFYYLIFDEKDNKYKIVDQDDFEEITSSAEISDCLAYLMHIDL